MALVFEDQECSLCGERLDRDPEFFATTALPDASGDGCHPLSDAAFHWECILNHPEGPALIDLSFLAWDGFYADNPYWKVWARTTNVRVATNSLVVRVEVREPHYTRDFPPNNWLAELRADIHERKHSHLPPRLITALHAGLEEIDSMDLPAA